MPKPQHTPEDIAKAQAVVTKIQGKVIDLLHPLAREMQIMAWKPDYCAIMWEAVAREAMKRSLEARRG